MIDTVYRTTGPQVILRTHRSRCQPYITLHLSYAEFPRQEEDLGSSKKKRKKKKWEKMLNNASCLRLCGVSTPNLTCLFSVEFVNI